jgi:hypothetical protein
MPLRSPHLRLVVAGLALLFAFTAVFVAAFRDPRPHDLHVGIVGPPSALHDARAALDPHRFTADPFPSEAAARRALLEDRLRGVLVAAPGSARILTASAYGSVPSLMTEQALTAVAATSGRPAATIDVRPLPAHDSRGLSAFGIVALLIAAIVLSVHGLGRLFGPVGMAAAALTFMLVGVSSAGGGLTYQLEPGFYRALSQLLPNGAALTALRNEVYFSGAHTLGALAALGAWTAGGALALALAAARRGRPAR